MGIVMPTVRHTGSLFMVNLLRPYTRVSIKGSADEHDRPLIFDHVYDSHMKRFHEWIKRYPTVVIPLRDPTDCAHGWAKRGEDFDRFFNMWENLLEFDQYGPFYVPIDHPERDDFLGDLSKHINMELKTDWRPHNTSNQPSRDIPDVSFLYNQPVIRDFYAY